MNTRLHRLGKVLLPLSHCSKLPLSSVQDPIQKGLLVHLTLQVFLLPFLAGFLLPQPGPLFSWPSLSARQEKKTRIFSSSKQQTQEKNYDVCLPLFSVVTVKLTFNLIFNCNLIFCPVLIFRSQLATIGPKKSYKLYGSGTNG